MEMSGVAKVIACWLILALLVWYWFYRLKEVSPYHNLSADELRHSRLLLKIKVNEQIACREVFMNARMACIARGAPADSLDEKIDRVQQTIDFYIEEFNEIGAELQSRPAMGAVNLNLG